MKFMVKWASFWWYGTKGNSTFRCHFAIFGRSFDFLCKCPKSSAQNQRMSSAVRSRLMDTTSENPSCPVSSIGDFEMAALGRKLCVWSRLVMLPFLVPEFARLIKVDDVIRWESGRGSKIRGERNRQIEMVDCCGCCDRNDWIVKNALIKMSNYQMQEESITVSRWLK